MPSSALGERYVAGPVVGLDEQRCLTVRVCRVWARRRPIGSAVFWAMGVIENAGPGLSRQLLLSPGS